MPSPQGPCRLALAGAALAVAALSGCAAVTPSAPPTGTQASPLSAVAVALPVCTSARELDGAPQDPETESCRPFEGYVAKDGTPRRFTSPGAGRLLVVAEVADGTPDPVLHLRRDPGTPLVRDDAVVSDELRPAVDGHHWVGYRSAVVTYAPGARDAGDVVETSAPAHASDAAAVRSLGVGDQVVRDGLGADLGDRAVDCDEPGATSSPFVLSPVSCPTSAAQVDAGVVTDAAVRVPDAISAPAGTTATLRFGVTLVGSVTDPSVLRVDADAAMAGATATPDTDEIPWPVTAQTPADLDPGLTDPGAVDPGAVDPGPVDPGAPPTGNETTPVAVTVAVPQDAVAGDHAVTLRVRDRAGIERTGVALLRVTTPTAAAPPPPADPTPGADRAAGPAPEPEQAPARAQPRTPVPATPAAPRTRPDPVTTISTLRTARVHPVRRRLHPGRVTCASATGCVVSTVVRAGGRRVGLVRFTLAPGTSGGVTRRLSRPATALLRRRGGTATVTVDTGARAPLVRVTRVVVTPRPRGGRG